MILEAYAISQQVETYAGKKPSYNRPIATIKQRQQNAAQANRHERSAQLTTNDVSTACYSNGDARPLCAVSIAFCVIPPYVVAVACVQGEGGRRREPWSQGRNHG